VHQFGHYPELHQDARSTKHKIPVVGILYESLDGQSAFRWVSTYTGQYQDNKTHTFTD
jgi:hypothetical protein